MTTLHTLVLALLQGLTEFLPISSSAHLILPSQVLDWPDQGIAFDVAVHLGTLLAVVGYFWRELHQLLGAWLRSLGGRRDEPAAKLAWIILLATLPAALFGLLANDLISEYLRSARVIAITTLLFGGLMWWADRRGRKVQPLESISLKTGLLVGLAQALALIPGTSRSGITMTAALWLGLTPSAAARFSFLLSIPIIVLAGGYESLKLVASPEVVDWGQMLLGVGVSFASALAVIHFFLKAISRIGLWPFVLYRLLLGVLLLIFFW